MVFKWAEYLRLAGELRAEADEASKRSAISRAYYAVYNTARLKQQGNRIEVRDEGEGSHQARWNAFRGHKDVRCQWIGINGDRLREKRKNADYSDEIHSIPSELATAMTLADFIMKSLAELPPELP